MKKSSLVICLVFALGIAVLLYPLVSAFVSKKTSTAAVTDYQTAVQTIDTGARDAMLAAAKAYNAKLAGSVTAQSAADAQNKAYQTMLNVDGIMGYLDIPRIQIHLPIYHGVEEQALQKGVGHLPESSLPVGGASTHAVLSAHCGLPSARLFTDLDQLQQGDLFFVHVLDKTLTYKVDQIQVVLPEEVSTLAIVPTADYITLLTCTPYGVNSHRLLVRGVRTADVPQAETQRKATQTPVQKQAETHALWWPWLLAIGIVALCLRKAKQKRSARR